ncbi:MAG: hypothetical protein HRT80_15715 [Henriciella sp.]|nr:hypothetical protein [Henriciella sp.]
MTLSVLADPAPDARRKVSASQLMKRLSTEAVNYTHSDRSFSPFWSNIGLTFGANCGIDQVHFHYNRQTVTTAGDAFGFAEPAHIRQASVLSVKDAVLSVAFFATDAFLIEAKKEITLGLLSDALFRKVREEIDGSGNQFIHSMMKNVDPRDPDPEVPVLLSVRVLNGAIVDGILVPDQDGVARAAFHFDLLTIDKDHARRTLLDAPNSIEEAESRAERWLEEALNGLELYPESDYEAEVLGRAVLTLLFNTVAAPGLLEGRLASFPSRGGYPTHFLWDALFHMLALEHMQPKLAEDALLILSDTIRPDGLMAHFVCATWVRPDASQPPLFGWAAERLVKQTGNVDLAKEVLSAIKLNTQWWLSQRMTSTGLIACFDPYETGWDDTPRLDDGPIVATDMNSYLLMQMRSAARLATFAGMSDEARHLNAQADEFAALMVEVLFDEESGRFHDLRIETGKKTDMLSPAIFLPLLGDVPLELETQKKMVTKYLFDKQRLFGHIPFPSVAYDDPAYDQKQMWRGPMWLPISWLLLELLEKLGFDDELSQCEKRLYEIVLEDGDLYEYFDSQTGGGLGYPQQGWTAAIFIRLHLILAGQASL